MHRLLVPALLLVALLIAIPGASAAPVATSAHDGCTLTTSVSRVNTNPQGFPIYAARFRGVFTCTNKKKTIHLNLIGYKETSARNVIKATRDIRCGLTRRCGATAQSQEGKGEGNNGWEIKGRYCTAAYIQIGSGRLWNDKVCRTFR